MPPKRLNVCKILSYYCEQHNSIGIVLVTLLLLTHVTTFCTRVYLYLKKWCLKKYSGWLVFIFTELASYGIHIIIMYWTENYWKWIETEMYFTYSYLGWMLTVDVFGNWGNVKGDSDIHVHVDVRRCRPFDEGIDVHAPEAFLCCFHLCLTFMHKLFIVFENDQVNVKLRQREIKMYLYGII